MAEETAAEFARTLWDEIDDRVRSGAEQMTADAFVRIAGEHLIEDGVLEDLEVCYHRAPVARGYMEVAGYAVSNEGASLDVVTAVLGSHGNSVPRDVVRRKLRQTELFVAGCHDGVHTTMEPSSPAFDMAQQIHASWPGLERVRIFFFTDGRVTLDRVEDAQIGGVSVSHELWDVTRLHRLVTSGREQGEIVVAPAAHDEAVSCMWAPPSKDGYRCLLALVPGALLAKMYEEYGARLLQRNVRAFLQIRGKVNKGINVTASQEPARFLAYNNGISATATKVETVQDEVGTWITQISNLQIVNGGQTTASLHHVWKSPGSDLSEILVPAKITVVDGELLDDLVPRISRYANSQNVIREADFEANSPFHVSLERLSRSVWAPALDGGTRQTHWYYERVRGQYQVDLARQRPPARRRDFKLENPANQRFSKTDVAKYEMAYLGHPHVVSLGAEKCFQRWTLDVVAKAQDGPDAPGFRQLAAKAILFEQARKQIQRLDTGGGGYLAQTTAYVIALLVARYPDQVDLARTWREQAVPPQTVRAVAELVDTVRPVLVQPPGSGNVTEWCKKEACWSSVRKADLDNPRRFNVEY